MINSTITWMILTHHGKVVASVTVLLSDLYDVCIDVRACLTFVREVWNWKRNDSHVFHTVCHVQTCVGMQAVNALSRHQTNKCSQGRHVHTNHVSPTVVLGYMFVHTNRRTCRQVDELSLCMCFSTDISCKRLGIWTRMQLLTFHFSMIDATDTPWYWGSISSGRSERST